MKPPKRIASVIKLISRIEKISRRPKYLVILGGVSELCAELGWFRLSGRSINQSPWARLMMIITKPKMISILKPSLKPSCQSISAQSPISPSNSSSTLPWYQQWQLWLIMIVTLALFTLLVNLGQWQLSRAAEKSQQEQQLLNNEQRAPVPLPQLLQQLPTPVLEHQQPLPSAFVGRQVQLIAHPLISRPFSPINQQDEQDNDVQQSIYLLDNQTVAGQVGYLGYQLMQVQLTDHPSKPETMQALSMPNSALMFVELGFIAAPKSRQQLPQFEAFTEQVTLQGRVYQKLRNPISEQLWLEDGAPKRIQNLNLAQLAQEFATQESLPLLPILLQPKQQPQPLVQPWQPLSMLSSKHYGYALQWFSLALALIVLTSYFVYRHFLNRH